MGRCWRAHVLRGGLRGQLPAPRTLRGQDPEGSEACRPAGGATDKVRAGDQSQDGKADRRDDSAIVAVPGGQGDQMNFGFSILDCGQDMTKTSQPAFLWFRSDNRKSAIQNPKWLGLLIIALVLVVGGTVARAQQPPKIPRIGYLTAADSSRPYQAFLEGLRDFGYVEGRNIAIEYRSADGKRERVPDLAAELVRLKVDVIVTDGAGPSQDAKKATSTIPIVMTSSGDPVGIGLIASLSHPG